MLVSMKNRIRRPPAGAVIGTLGLAAAVGGVAYGAIPGEDGQIKACYATSSGLLLGIPYSKGDLRAIDSSASCRSYERALRWSQQGPRGERGPQGEQGEPGPSAVFTATGDVVGVDSGSYKEVVSRELPPGSYALTLTAGMVSDNYASDCRLVGPAGTVSHVRSSVPLGGFKVQSLALTGATTLATAGKVAAECAEISTSGGFQVRDSTLTAIRVGAVNP